MAKPSNQLSIDSQLCFSLYSTSLAMTQVYKPLLEPMGLTYPQYLVMLILWENDGLGLKQVADKLGQKPGALTPVIKRMEADGFLHRVRNKGDERSISITLTEHGRKLQKDAKRINQCIFESCGLKLSELEELREKLGGLRQKLRGQYEL
ncbi:MarR family transcriptional regulator [Hahella sp. CCB-MM4]|uniref:MarR family winged helix-turn-helix transcriptional regulator n=1 Tax=Hahella sp. (strain CCB-MM4) TaxID=1926491 RepID=UPI000B9B6F32|nr:MarR family transcriptional regulator [Hahella sp. CCB-MM4]OZG71749.1 MarR family transcriptional regulator [Hahella sp. CCB-MM4]